MYAAMLGAFPVARNQELNVTLDGYLTLTADIPFGWLQTAVRYLMMHPDTTFAPTVGKIRERSAIEIIRTKRVAEGKDPDRGRTGPTHVPADRIDQFIAMARRLVGLPAIEPASAVIYIPAELEEKIAAIGARIIDDREEDGDD